LPGLKRGAGALLTGDIAELTGDIADWRVRFAAPEVKLTALSTADMSRRPGAPSFKSGTGEPHMD
jgi:hypothetical protein